MLHECSPSSVSESWEPLAHEYVQGATQDQSLYIVGEATKCVLHWSHRSTQMFCQMQNELTSVKHHM